MKNLNLIAILIIAIAFMSCGKKHIYTCTPHPYPTWKPTTKMVLPYTGEMTKAEARRYEREHCEKGSYYTECVK